jgi:hypothetical protein
MGGEQGLGGNVAGAAEEGVRRVCVGGSVEVGLVGELALELELGEAWQHGED